MHAVRRVQRTAPLIGAALYAQSTATISPLCRTCRTEVILGETNPRGPPGGVAGRLDPAPAVTQTVRFDTGLTCKKQSAPSKLRYKCKYDVRVI